VPEVPEVPACARQRPASGSVRLDYVAEDRRRRDFPAICDALWHALERAGVVTDDTLLWPAQSSRSYDKAAPGCTITFLD